MKTFLPFTFFITFLFFNATSLFFPKNTSAQSYAAWYRNAQERIDTLRKGDFGIRIVDRNGQPYSGEFSVRMAKHEYPFGVAFDLSDPEPSMGNSYSSQDDVQAETDAEIYKTERWAKYLAYAIPVKSGKVYAITLKFAELVHEENNLRVFDVKVDENIFLEGFDVHALAGGKNKAIDTSLQIRATSNQIIIELLDKVDNASIKGIVVEELEGGKTIRINCGGNELTTKDGYTYITENGFFDVEVNAVPTRDDWRKATMYKYFNAAVNENSFKWSGVQSNQNNLNYTNFDRVVRWTQKVGWDLRAHTLLWGGNDNHSMPNWVRNLPTPQAIVDTCKMRVIRDVTRYRGIINEYDVINEPLTNHADWLRKTVGDTIIWESYKWARSADPDAQLFINDYNVEYNWGQAREYRDLIFKMLENGAPVTGIGMQSHYWNGLRPNVDEVVRNVNILAETGLPIKFTEFDYGGDITQAQQASDYIKVLTIAFSHPSVVGMYHWSLRDGWSWREGSGMFDSDGIPKLAADTLLYYTKTKWATNFDTVTLKNDPVVFNAYFGNYNIEVDFDGVVKVFNVPFLKANADSIFILNENDALLKGPQLIGTELVDVRKIKLIFDKPIDENTMRRSDFKIFSNRSFRVNAVELDPINDNELIVSLNINMIAGNYLAISYLPGRLKATDGSTAMTFGPEEIANPILTVGNPIVNNSSIKIYPNPATDIINIEHQSAPYRVSIYNSLGMSVFSEESESNNIKLDVSSFKRGIYMIRLTNADNVSDVQKFLLK